MRHTLKLALAALAFTLAACLTETPVNAQGPLTGPADCMETDEAEDLLDAYDEAVDEYDDAGRLVQTMVRRERVAEAAYGVAVATAHACWMAGPATWAVCGPLTAAAAAAAAALTDARSNTDEARDAQADALGEVQDARRLLHRYMREHCGSNGEYRP